MARVTWRRGDDLAALPLRLGYTSASNSELIVLLRCDDPPEDVLGAVVAFDGPPVTTVTLRQGNSVWVPVPVDLIAEVCEPEVQTACACGGQIAAHVVVDGPLYPQLCSSCRDAEDDGSDDRDGRLDR